MCFPGPQPLSNIGDLGTGMYVYSIDSAGMMTANDHCKDSICRSKGWSQIRPLDLSGPCSTSVLRITASYSFLKRFRVPCPLSLTFINPFMVRVCLQFYVMVAINHSFADHDCTVIASVLKNNVGTRSPWSQQDMAMGWEGLRQDWVYYA